MPASNGENDPYSTEIDEIIDEIDEFFYEGPEDLLDFYDLLEYDDIKDSLQSVVQRIEEIVEDYEYQAEDLRFEIGDSDNSYDREEVQSLLEQAGGARREIQHLQPKIDKLSSQLDIFKQAHSQRIKMAEDQAAEEGRMDEIASLPHLSSTASDSSGTTNLQAAWERKDHEMVVQLASTLVEDASGAPGRDDLDGVRHLCTGLRLRFKAYTAMRLYSLAVGDASRLLDLLTTYGADVQGDDDLEVGSTTGIQSEPAARRRSARLSQPRGQKRSATPKASGGQQSKRSRLVRSSQPQPQPQPEPTSGNDGETISILYFPVELILLIANHLSITDRLHLANTCHDWRRIPQLWQSLKFRRTKSTGKDGWHYDTVQACVTAIEICQRRSRGTLTCVKLQGFVTSGAVGPILDILQLSSATLQHVAIPTLDQKLCFDRLYYRCPNLTGIDVRFTSTSDANVLAQDPQRITSPFQSDTLPFQLRSFYSRADLPYGPLTSHMEGLQVVHCMAYKRQKKLSFVDGLLRAAPTLVEWWDDVGTDWYRSVINLGDFGIERLAVTPLVFPKLRRLNALWSEIFIDCEFPALREARINSMRGPSTLDPATSTTFSRAAAIITASPLLKKLEILLPPGFSAQRQIYVAISKLRHLEELTLCTTDSSLSLRPLLDAEEELATPKSAAQETMPALQTLRIILKTCGRGNDTLVNELVELLLIRYYRREGHTYSEAKTKMTQARQAYQAYLISLNKPPKPPKPPAKKTAKKKKGANDAVEEPLDTKEDVKPPKFTSVLSQLVLPPEKVYERGEMRSWWRKSDTVLSQLIFQIVEAENPKEYNDYTRGGGSGRGAYY